MSDAAKDVAAEALPPALTAAAPDVAPLGRGRGTFLFSLAVALAIHGGLLWAMVSGHLRLGAGGQLEEAIEVTVVDATILESLSSETSKQAESKTVPSEDGNAPKDAIASIQSPPAKPVEKIETKPEEKAPPVETAKPLPPPPEPPKEAQSITQSPPELKPTVPPPVSPEPQVVTATAPATEAAPEQKEPPKPVEPTNIVEPATQPPPPPEKKPEPPRETEPPKPEPIKPEPKKPEPKKPVEQAEPKPSPRPPSEAAKKGTNSSRSLETATNKNGKATATPGEANQYAARVRSRIAQNRPDGLSLRGTTIVAFIISETGKLSQVAVANSSGDPRLDQAALQAVRNSAPFPVPPPGLSQRQLSFSINFVFQ